jgi:hypothetical protein
MNLTHFSKLLCRFFVKGYLISKDKCLTGKSDILILFLRKTNSRIFSINKKGTNGKRCNIEVYYGPLISKIN